MIDPIDTDTDLGAYLRYRFAKAFRNALLYGNPHGPVYGPMPRGILPNEPSDAP